LKTIYTSATEQQAQSALDAFGEKWDKKYPTISPMWRKNWERVIPFFDYPEDIRKVIYTTNAIESLNRSLRKVIKNQRSIPQRCFDTEDILPCPCEYRQEVDNADTHVEGCVESVCN
jgi:transposase-like protein